MTDFHLKAETGAFNISFAEAELNHGKLIAERVVAVANAPTEDFRKLLEVAGLDPAKDLRFQDWSGSNFENCDLTECDFSYSRLIGCNFKGARIKGARFDKAEIFRAGLDPKLMANLQEATDWFECKKMWNPIFGSGQLDMRSVSDYFKYGSSHDFTEAFYQTQESKRPISDGHLQIGAIFQDTPFAPEMVIVPPGKFMVGSRDNEGEADERLQHEVTIPQALAVGRFVVTFEEWDFAQADKDWWRITGVKPRKPTDKKWSRNRRPIIDISWNDAQAYIKWLSVKTGQIYRLLSEVEWEYVARAGASTDSSFGDKSLAAVAEMFGLTFSEACTLEYFLEGVSVAEAAKTLKISENTVKTHLQNIFAKTGTSRQTHLVKLVNDLKAPLRPEKEAQILANVAEIHDLTSAEVRTLACFIEGVSVAEAAQTLKISENMVKTHLQNIFAKTVTSRQTHLLKLVNDLKAQLRSEKQARISEEERDNSKQAIEVGFFPANDFGLYKHSDIWEWCEDTWHEISSEKLNATGGIWISDEASQHVLRSGSLVNYPQSLHTAFRRRNVPDDPSNNFVGFRVARTLKL